jgi:hypothetical protein
MALKQCRECKAEVSTEAKTCPKYGAPARSLTFSLMPRLRRRVLFLVGAILFLAPAIATTADAEAPLDFTKPLFARAGFPACASAEAVEAIFQALAAGRNYMPAECGIIKRDVPVIITNYGGLGGPYRVRFLNTSANAGAWVPYSTLRN